MITKDQIIEIINTLSPEDASTTILNLLAEEFISLHKSLLSLAEDSESYYILSGEPNFKNDVIKYKNIAENCLDMYMYFSKEKKAF